MSGFYYMVITVFGTVYAIFLQSSAIMEKRPKNADIRAKSGRLTEEFDCAELFTYLPHPAYTYWLVSAQETSVHICPE